MTMIPPLVTRYTRLTPDLAALGALHSIFRRPCRGPDVPITLPLPVPWGCCNYTPAPSCQKAPTGFLPRGPGLRPLLSCGVRLLGGY